MGVIYALLASLANSSIGIFSRLSYNTNIDYSSLAFYRCFLAFAFLSIYFLIKKDGLNSIMKLSKVAPKIGLVSFFGIFILYYFEIWALSETTIPIVSFLLYASGIFTVILGLTWLKEKITLKKVIAITLVFLGLFMFFMNMLSENINIFGGFLAIIAGTGYSLFLVLTKKLKIPGNLEVLWWLFGFGSLYLSIPFLINGVTIPKLEAVPIIVSLSIIPTIGGFYCTTKSLDLLDASKVQLIEMTEPVFASIFALILFSEILSFNEIVAAMFILLGVLVLELKFRVKNPIIASSH